MMEFIEVDYKDIPEISKRDLAFIQKDEQLTPFVRNWAKDLNDFKSTIARKNNQSIDRQTLVEVLKSQYALAESSSAVHENIESLLSPNTYTVVTAHQPSLLTGPLYYIYKICSAINLSKQLTEHYPEYKVVPVFVSGGEDHDFDEINHLHLYNKTISWERKSTGPVGRLSTEGLDKVVSDVKDILGDGNHTQQLYTIIDNCLAKAKTYSQFMFLLTDKLFSAYGLIYLNMDSKPLKAIFKPVIKEELLTQQSHAIVTNSINQLNALGFKTQANPREINLFYLRDDLRNRISLEGENYQVVDTDISFTKQEILEELDSNPDRFSPNVVLRPLYQELILPNLAYIGGGGEIAYWTERADQFDHFQIPFPLLIRRNSALQVSKGISKQVAKTEFNLTDFMKEEQSLINHFLSDYASDSLDLTEERNQLQEIFDKLATKATDIEGSLSKYVLSEGAKQLKTIDNIESKLTKALKAKNNVDLNRLSNIRTKLFPNKGLQERYDNALSYYAMFGQDWISEMISYMNPLTVPFIIISL